MLVHQLLGNAQKFPKKIAFFAGEVKITYAELKQHIFNTADYLNSLGIQQGERILLYASNEPNFIYAYFAIHLLGAIAVPIDPASPKARIDHIISQIKPSHTVEKNLHIANRNNNLAWNTDALPSIHPSNIADILFTTGTTGKPKGVMLSHLAITTAANNINNFIENTAEDCELITVPICHSFGLGRIRCILMKGGSFILNQNPMNINAIFKALGKCSTTGISIVPAGIAILLQLTKNKLANFADQLHYVEIGSAPMPIEIKKQLLKLLPTTRICMHYGLTEASRSAFIQLDQNNLSSIGKPLPNVNIAIVDKAKKPVNNNKKGELLIKGDHIMSGYWNNNELTKKTLVNGWLYTGDIGHYDDQGNLFLDGRNHDMINSGGKKISPMEVEMQLRQHPAIEDCACIGVPCSQGIAGEVIKAFIISADKTALCQPSSQMLSNFLSDKLEPYKIPTTYEWIDKIPQTSSGKTQYHILRTREQSVVTSKEDI